MRSRLARRLGLFVRRHGAAASITFVAFVVRAIGIGFSGSLPWARPDEQIFVGRALIEFQGKLDPKWAAEGFPEGYFQLVHLAQRVYDAWLRLRFGREVNLGCLYVLDAYSLDRLGRWISCILGTLTIPATMMLATVCMPRGTPTVVRRYAPICAGVFMALDQLHARDSHFGVSDAPMLYFMTYAFAFLARGLVRDRMRDYVIGGFALGLATSIKWAALGVYPAFALMVVARIVVPRRRGVLAGLSRATWAGVAWALGFVCLSPHFVVEPDEFISGIQSVSASRASSSAQTWDPMAPANTGLDYHFFVSLPGSLGWPCFALAILGTFLALTKRRAPLLGMAAWSFIFYFLALAKNTVCYARYTLPIHPALVVCAAWVVAMLLPKRIEELGRGAATTAVCAACALVMLAPIADLFGFLRAAVRPDTREVAAEWLVDHMRGDDRLVALGNLSFAVQTLPREMIDSCNAVMPESLRRRVPYERRNSENMRIDIDIGRRGWNHLLDLTIKLSNSHEPTTNGEWVAISRPGLPCGQLAPAEFDTAPTGACFVERAHFSPGRAECDAVYQTMDYVFFPFTGYRGVHSLGPDIRIYENVCRTAHRR